MEKVKEKLEANKKFEKTHIQLVASKNLTFKNGTRGITLIALVITIIVLLILAAVSIATLTGDNGILTKAETAQTKNEVAQVEEEMKLVVADWQLEKRSNSSANLGEFLNTKKTNGEIDDITDNGDGSYTIEVNRYEATISDEEGLGEIQPPVELVNAGKTAQKTQRNNYRDSNNDRATIPEGFTVSAEDNTIDTGLVVTAPDESEFVWVPVPKAIATTSPEEPVKDTKEKAMAVKQEDGNYRGLLYDFKGTGVDSYSELIVGCTTTNFEENTGYREPAYLSSTSYDNNSTNNPEYFTEESLKREYKAMVESVEKYKGFYVGRYETSYDGTNVASKRGKTPMSANDDSQMWYGMYNKQKNYASSIKVKEKEVVSSSMIWGSQWDSIMNWMLTSETEKIKVTANSTRYLVDITGNSKDVMNKIYDLGNLNREWTIEVVNDGARVMRGSNNSNTWPPSYRGAFDPNFASYPDHCSRLTLYIK